MVTIYEILKTVQQNSGKRSLFRNLGVNKVIRAQSFMAEKAGERTLLRHMFTFLVQEVFLSTSTCTLQSTQSTLIIVASSLAEKYDVIGLK